MKYSVQRIAVLTFLLFIALTPRADAYLDPSTGSYLLQLAAAALFGGLFAVKTWWRQIKAFIDTSIMRKDTKTSEKKHPKEK